MSKEKEILQLNPSIKGETEATLKNVDSLIIDLHPKATAFEKAFNGKQVWQGSLTEFLDRLEGGDKHDI